MPSRKKSGARMTNKAEPPKPNTEMAEIGATGLQQFSGLVNEEFLHQLQGKNAVRVFREMSENDAIVRAIMYAFEMLLRPVTWTTEPGGETPQDQEAADWLGTIWPDMSHTPSDFISEWMACPIFGYAPFEIVYKVRDGNKDKPGESSLYDDGKIGVRKLAIRHPATLDRWLFDDAGGLQGMIQRAAPKWTPVSLPIEKLLLFRCMARKGNPEGTSMLRGAYLSWFRKKKLETIEAIGIERNLAGLPVIYYPPEWGVDGQHSAKLDELKRIVRRVKVDEQAGLTLPAIYDEGGNQMLRFELVATSGKTGLEVSPIIERYARHMAMTVLADVILLGHEKVGSFSLADSKTNLFTVGLGAMLDDIRDTLNRHLVPRLMQLNGFKVTTPPKFEHSDLETVDLTGLGTFLNQMASAGAPLFPSENGELERHLYRVAGLPVPESFPAPRAPYNPFADDGADLGKDDDDGEDDEEAA